MNSIETKKLYESGGPAMIAQHRNRMAESVTSRDGTCIQYWKLGKGPGIVMLHGAMESARSHMKLAEALAGGFTVYLPERRGHHLGVPFRKDYSMQQELQDLESLLVATGTRNVFGVSAGGLIALQAALTLPKIHKVAVYEPALIVRKSISTDFISRYDREIVQGKLAAALITGMKGAQFGPAAFNILPRWFLELVTTMTMKKEEKNAKSGDVTMRMLAPTLHYDFNLIVEMADQLENWKQIQQNVLLLGGAKSPVWLKMALDTLQHVLPRVERIEFAGLDHGGSSDLSNTNPSGKPELVAPELGRFFSKPSNG